ncbi:MAG: RIP metalloprotease RseP [Rhodospirillales bacterium]|nr:RIP metalloprotease RseP [Rhodospirillales bacterium]
MPAPLGSLIPFVVLLSILVFVHEYGHYFVARSVGVFVETFSVGFGPAIVSWKDSAGTIWKIGCIPLGGYVKLHGHDPNEPDPEVRAAWMAGRTFHEKSIARRAAVVAAGPIANFLLAMVVFTTLFMTAGREIPQPVVSTVAAGSPAAAAGFAKGDRIVAIAGARIADFGALQRVIAGHPGKPMAFTVERAGKQLTLEATPAARNDGAGKVGYLGIGTSVFKAQRLGPVSAVRASAIASWSIAAATLHAVGSMVSGQGAKDLGGPLRIAAISGQAAQLGFANFVSLIGLLSVNLGLINLFPIPVLDGGHLLFFAFEAVRGRPLTQQAQEWGLKTGLALIGALFVFATWNDVRALKIVTWFRHLLG